MTYHIITIGCQMNKSDSERLAAVLEKQGYKWANDKYRADLVVINTCGVRQSAEDRVFGFAPRIKKENPKVKIILTGCLAKREDVRKKLKNSIDLWLPTEQMVCGDYLKIKPKYTSKISAFMPIGNGCNNFCSYCVVPYARGREVYRPVEDILSEVKYLVKNGCKEITLIAQNVNSYKSKKIDFADLLKMIDNIKGDFWIRFATSHPKDVSDKLIRTMAQGKKICNHLHLPVQAGDNGILKKMNRRYTVADYKKLIKKVRQAMPNISLTTDIIVGFSGETKKQFNNTAKLFKEIKFDMAYIAQYSPRPDTAAAKLADNISRAEKKKREKVLMKILRQTALINNKKYIGETVKILAAGKNKQGELFGSSETAKIVKISAKNFNRNNDKLIGKFIVVKINQARDFGLAGTIIK